MGERTGGKRGKEKERRPDEERNKEKSGRGEGGDVGELEKGETPPSALSK